MNDRTCTGCGSSFTPTHGRQRCCSPACRQPSHAKITLRCDGCGGPALKYKQSRRYANTYCSLACRDQALKGKRQCAIPAQHWARWFGRTSSIQYGECQWCGGVMTDHHGKQVCSDRCKWARKGQRRAARMAGASGDYRWSDLFKLWVKLRQCCAYCLEPLPLEQMQAEHVTPLTRGGRNDISNLLPACRDCNSEKSDRTPAEWDEDRTSRGLPPRSRHIVRSDARFAHLVTFSPIGVPYRNRIAA